MSVKRILDPEFRYEPSYATDVRRTFERIRREREQDNESAKEERGEGALRLINIAAARARFP
jgi:tRNA(Ile)-lysidine synthase TilS/MesJ